MVRLRYKRKWLTCLRCGNRIWTDVGHRFCRRCRRANERIAETRDVVRISPEAAFAVGQDREDGYIRRE